ncbi:hypothetical protein [Spirosoma endophyticum]
MQAEEKKRGADAGRRTLWTCTYKHLEYFSGSTLLASDLTEGFCP